MGWDRCAAFALVFSVVLSQEVDAQPGTLLRQVANPSGAARGVGIGVDCDGNLYYTNFNSSTLHVLDANGAAITTRQMQDASGNSVVLNALSYDATRDLFWGLEQASSPTNVYQLDKDTGTVTFQWSASTSGFAAKDGIAFDASDDTIWISEDVSTTVEHYRTDGTLIGSITPKNASGGTLGTLSGLAVGVGDLLYVGRNGAVEIVQVTKSNGDFVDIFASPGGNRDEGLECDPLNFAPKLALWSRDVDGALSAIELQAGTCACGGGICANQADSRNYGQGCAGTQGTPTIGPRAGDAPVLCTTQYTVDISNSLGSQTPGCVMLSFNKASSAIFGCTLLVDLNTAIVLSITVPAGGGSVSFDLPCSPNFCGRIVNMQSVQLDGGAAQGVAFTDGLELTLGS